MTKKIKIWLARDFNGDLYIYRSKPEKNLILNKWFTDDSEGAFIVDNSDNIMLFPGIHWCDKKPVEIELEF